MRAVQEPPAQIDPVARWVSALTTPFLTTPLFILMGGFRFVPDLPRLALYGAIAVGFTVGIPLAYAELLRRRGEVDSVHIFDRRARLKPLALTGASSMAGFGLLYLVGAPLGILQLGAMLFLLAVAMLLATSVLKVSGHTSAWAAGSAVVVMLYGLPVGPVLLGAVPIGWSRMVLGRHDLREVAAGFAFGILAATVLGLIVGIPW
jgi:membrane-associated phospholipid phosphatase